MKNWLAIRPPIVADRADRLAARLRDRRLPPIALILAGLSFAAIVINVAQGEYPIAIADIIKTLLGIDTGNPDLPA